MEDEEENKPILRLAVPFCRCKDTLIIIDVKFRWGEGGGGGAAAGQRGEKADLKTGCTVL